MQIDKSNFDQERILQIMFEAVKVGGEVLKRYFSDPNISYTTKSSSSDYQTVADVESDKVIVDFLQKNVEGFNILTEERGLIDNGSDFEFLLDPLDGSFNYASQPPLNIDFNIALSLKFKGETIIGVIYQPILEYLTYAVKGNGAYACFFGNERKLQVLKTKELKDSIVAYTMGYPVGKEFHTILLHKMFDLNSFRVENIWCPSMLFSKLSHGGVQGLINCGVESYDFEAGLLIATEAGAVKSENIVTDFTKKLGKEFFVISNGVEEIQNILLRVLKDSLAMIEKNKNTPVEF